MSNVTLQIAGRSYVVACADGEEAHVTGLANGIDAKLSGMAGQSESRTLLFAALLLADELHERDRAVQEAPGDDVAGADTDDEAMLEQHLIRLADRLENLATRLESASASD